MKATIFTIISATVASAAVLKRQNQGDGYDCSIAVN
jgi:hypothetical protein